MFEDLSVGFFLIFMCLMLSAYFSAVETTVTSLSSLKTKHLRENSGPLGKVLDLWINVPQRVLIAVLVGNNLVNIFAAVYTDNLIAHAFGQSHTWIVTLVMTVIIVLFSEIIPKTLAKNYATNLVIPLLNIFRIFYWLFSPFTFVASWMMERLSSVFSRHAPKTAPNITEEELEFLINVGEEEGVLPEQKHEMLSGIFELGDTVVREIMVHRLDVTALSSHSKIIDAHDVFRDTGLSRIPVFDERIDNIVGILHFKDVAYYLRKNANDSALLERPISDLKRDAIFVPESKEVDALFQEMRRQRQHVAIVLDEYGGTSGLVTMEDVFEEIVGEIRDEFDNEEDAIRPTQVTNQYLVECKIHFDDFCDYFELDAESAAKSEGGDEYDTLGGFVMHHFGQVPKLGDKLELDRVTLEIIEVSKRRVRRVLAKVTRSAGSPKPVDEQLATLPVG